MSNQNPFQASATTFYITHVRSAYTTNGVDLNGVDLNGVEGCSPGIKGVSGYYVS